MGRCYKDESTGKLYPHPITIEHAKSVNNPLYSTDTRCPKCNIGLTRIVATGDCLNCKRLEAHTFNNMKVWIQHNGSTSRPLFEFDDDGTIWSLCEVGRRHEVTPEQWEEMYSQILAVRGQPVTFTPDPCKRKGHMGVRLNGKCWYCQAERTPRMKAKAEGETWYTPETICPRCQTLSLKRVSNGECKGCSASPKKPSPRQEAIAAGEAWYMPTTACKQCGTVSLKRVNNGECQGCVA